MVKACRTTRLPSVADATSVKMPSNARICEMVFSMKGESSAINVRTGLRLWMSAWAVFIFQLTQSVAYDRFHSQGFELDGRAQRVARVHTSSWPGWLIWVGHCESRIPRGATEGVEQ